MTALTQSIQSVVPNARRKRTKLKLSTIAVYASAFVLLVAIVALGYRAPERGVGPVANVNATQTPGVTEQISVDDVVAANVAVSLASAVDLSVTGSVKEYAAATQAQRLIESSNGLGVSGPTIVALSSASRGITTYTVVDGDTVPSVAAKFGLTADTIRWANNLTGDRLTAGSALNILPSNGITYTIREGDTAQSIAEKYKSDAALIITTNDLEISGVTPGLKIVVPNGILPNNERPGYVAPSTFITGYSAGAGSGRTWLIRYGTPNRGNYAWGNCTAYAFDRRADLGRPIGGNWGNAGSWANSARNAGYVVNRTPAAGAVIQDWGHVAIVEQVLPNGDLELSEMNYYAFGASGANNTVSGRILPAAYVGQYYYIH